VQHGDATVALTQVAYIVGSGESKCGEIGPFFTAHGLDALGNDYTIIWDCVDGWESMDDLSDCCDWGVCRVYPQ